MRQRSRSSYVHSDRNLGSRSQKLIAHGINLSEQNMESRNIRARYFLRTEGSQCAPMATSQRTSSETVTGSAGRRGEPIIFPPEQVVVNHIHRYPEDDDVNRKNPYASYFAMWEAVLNESILKRRLRKYGIRLPYKNEYKCLNDELSSPGSTALCIFGEYWVSSLDSTGEA